MPRLYPSGFWRSSRSRFTTSTSSKRARCSSQAELRKVSSRADITSSRLSVVYNWGSFKGDPDRLMERYFDAFVYVANQASRELQLRLPRSLFDPARAEPFLNEETLSLRTTREHVLLTFRIYREDEADGGDWSGWPAALLPLRAELLAGDLRSLYIAWLARVALPSYGEEDEPGMEEELEPPVPPGEEEREDEAEGATCAIGGCP